MPFPSFRANICVFHGEKPLSDTCVSFFLVGQSVRAGTSDICIFCAAVLFLTLGDFSVIFCGVAWWSIVKV